MNETKQDIGKLYLIAILRREGKTEIEIADTLKA
jgi:hypothetical protein